MPTTPPNFDPQTPGVTLEAAFTDMFCRVFGLASDEPAGLDDDLRAASRHLRLFFACGAYFAAAQVMRAALDADERLDSQALEKASDVAEQGSRVVREHLTRVDERN